MIHDRGFAMIQVSIDLPLDAVEPALRRAAQRCGAGLIGSTHVGQHLEGGTRDAVVFSLCHPELYAALLESEIRAAALLPCRIAAYTERGRVVLESVSPLEFCRILNRPDLAPLLVLLESAISGVMHELAQPQVSQAFAAVGARRGALGATEEQVNVRGLVPQRIDCRGTKVEDLAGTGEPDTKGG